jgi:acetylglutamate kinase
MKLYIVKIGGNVIDDSESLHHFLQDFADLDGFKILVHGGGKVATELSEDLGIEAKMHEGRRITDIETLRIVTMVYAGLINKNIVAQLQSRNCNAIGLSGADGNTIKADKRPVKNIDYGFVGDIGESSVNAGALKKLLEGGFIPVFSAITHDGAGQLLNTNADTIASALAVSLSSRYETSLIYCFEKKGVLKNVEDEFSIIRLIKSTEVEELSSKGVISGGMLPKIHNAFEAINKGVKEVLIGKADELSQLNHSNSFGTKLIH